MEPHIYGRVCSPQEFRPRVLRVCNYPLLVRIIINQYTSLQQRSILTFARSPLLVNWTYLFDTRLAITVPYRQGDSNLWIQLRYGTAKGRILTVWSMAVAIYGMVDTPSLTLIHLGIADNIYGTISRIRSLKWR